MNSKQEEWRSVVGYEGHYEVSSLGNVRSLARIIKRKSGDFRAAGCTLSPGLGDTGYYHVNLSLNKRIKVFRVHRLVAQAFIPNPDNKPEVNHKASDGNRKNNAVGNLEWATRLENIRHSYSELNHPSAWTGKENRAIQKPVEQLNKSGEVIGWHGSIGAAAKAVGVQPGCIGECVNGRQKTSAGFLWRFAPKSRTN